MVQKQTSCARVCVVLLVEKLGGLQSPFFLLWKGIIRFHSCFHGVLYQKKMLPQGK